MTSSHVITSNQVEQLRSLLKTSKLPFDDVTMEGNLFKLYYAGGDMLIGSGGLEFYGDFALLRSVAVVDAERGKGIGKAIVGDLIGEARNHALHAVYLLTETAPDFFTRIGFEKIERDAAPESVKISSEFSSVCPSSAVCMEILLG